MCFYLYNQIKSSFQSPNETIKKIYIQGINSLINEAIMLFNLVLIYFNIEILYRAKKSSTNKFSKFQFASINGIHYSLRITFKLFNTHLEQDFEYFKISFHINQYPLDTEGENDLKISNDLNLLCKHL